MDYSITVTLGPASREESFWKDFLKAGADMFRLNTSHMSIDELNIWMDRLNSFYSQMGLRIPVVLDLQGSKWRLGEFPPVILAEGQIVELKYALNTSEANTLPVPHADFFEAALASDKEIILNDAKVALLLESAEQNLLYARVIKGGEVSSKKGITFSSSDYRKESLSEKDKQIITYGQQYDFVRYAISYIKDLSEMNFYRKHIGTSAYLIAKLERESAIREVLEIADYANEIWICRGDLGSELGLKSMATAVNYVLSSISKIKVPVLMAGQVLEHMTMHISPTRSEICYMYDSLLNGCKGFVLSDECAIGKYPIESCRTAAMFR